MAIPYWKFNGMPLRGLGGGHTYRTLFTEKRNADPRSTLQNTTHQTGYLRPQIIVRTREFDERVVLTVLCCSAG